MSWFDMKPLGVPANGRAVSAGSKTPSEQSDDCAGEDEGADPERLVVVAPTPQRGVRTVPEPSKSPYYKKGTRLRYKSGMGPKILKGVVFVVMLHTVKGIYFERRDGAFSPDYFELAA
jgi:hypothetical protein